MCGFVNGKAYMATSTVDHHRKAVVVAAGRTDGMLEFVKVSGVGQAIKEQTIGDVAVAIIGFDDGHYCATSSVELSNMEAQRVCDALLGNGRV